MAPKFNLETADKDSLKERVKQLTSALVKQKDVLEKLRASENELAGSKEKLERQVRDLTEEADVSRNMRSELQSEVARLQNQVDIQQHEMAILKDQSQTTEATGSEQNGVPKEEKERLETALKNAETEVTELHEQVALHKGESQALQEQLDALKSSYARMERKMATNASFVTSTSSFVESVVGSEEVKLDGEAEVNITVDCAEKIHTGEPGRGADQSTGRPTEDDDVAAESESQMKLMEALSQARMECVAKESLAARLHKELDQARMGIKRAEDSRNASESKMESLQASLERSQAAFTQAKELMKELEKSRDVKDKELSSLKEDKQRKSEEEDAVASKWSEESIQLKLKLSELQDSLTATQRERQKAEKKAQSAIETTASLENKIRSLQVASATKEKETAAQVKKAEERELQARKELEVTKSQVEAAEQKHALREEELRHQLEMDKQIVKGMQAEQRAKALETETALLAVQGQLAEKDEMIRSLREDAKHHFMDADTAAQLDITPVRMGSDHLQKSANTPSGSDFEANFEPVFSTENHMPHRGSIGDSTAFHDALVAVEELIEVLSSDSVVAREIDLELVALEDGLSVSGGQDPVQRRTRALCGLCRIAVDHIRDSGLPPSSVAHDVSRDIFDQHHSIKKRLAWLLQGLIGITREGCCGWSDRGRGGGYSRVVNPS